MAVKSFIFMFVSLLLSGCASQGDIARLQSQIDELERHRQGLAFRVECETDRLDVVSGVPSACIGAE